MWYVIVKLQTSWRFVSSSTAPAAGASLTINRYTLPGVLTPHPLPHLITSHFRLLLWVLALSTHGNCLSHFYTLNIYVRFEMLRKSVLYLTRARAGKYLYVLMTDGPGSRDYHGCRGSGSVESVLIWMFIAGLETQLKRETWYYLPST